MPKIRPSTSNLYTLSEQMEEWMGHVGETLKYLPIIDIASKHTLVMKIVITSDMTPPSRPYGVKFISMIRLPLVPTSW